MILCDVITPQETKRTVHVTLRLGKVRFELKVVYLVFYFNLLLPIITSVLGEQRIVAFYSLLAITHMLIR